MNVYVVGKGAVGSFWASNCVRSATRSPTRRAISPRSSRTTSIWRSSRRNPTIRVPRSRPCAARCAIRRRRRLRHAAERRRQRRNSSPLPSVRSASSRRADRAVGPDRDGRPVAANGGAIVVRTGRSGEPAQLAAGRVWGDRNAGLGRATDYRALKWSKLALNIVANASCAILNVLPERLVHMTTCSRWRSAPCARCAT